MWKVHRVHCLRENCKNVLELYIIIENIFIIRRFNCEQMLTVNCLILLSRKQKDRRERKCFKKELE
jgi:hypothetical protein